jgi:drug/metabolite transporter (DMT)-like permease
MEKQRTFAYLEALFAVVVWGASFIATKVALKEVSPVTIVWLRFGIGVILLGTAVVMRHQFALPARQEWGYFAMLGFSGITFHQWLQSNGLITAQASTTAWIVATTPVFMALLGWLLLKERLGWRKILGMALAAVGVLLVVTNGRLNTIVQGKSGTVGDFLILISAPNWAIFSVLSRRGLKKHPATRMMFFVMSLGWLFTTLHFFAGRGFSEIGRLSWNGWMAVLFLGLFCSGLAYIAWYDALQALSAAQTGVFLYIEPLVAVVVAALILAEAITWTSLLGGAVILLGVWLVNRTPEEKRHHVPTALHSAGEHSADS